jgi:tetratricopeptide (TPR) repeat protein
MTRGYIRLARGNLVGALEDADAGLNLARHANSMEVLYPALAVRARFLLAAGRLQDAAMEADELLSKLTERGLLALGLSWSGDLALVLQGLGRGAELVELIATATLQTPWHQAAIAVATREFERAAELYAQIGSLPDQSFAHLRAAERMFAAGHRTEASAHVEQALAFYRQVRADAYLDEGAALLAASA